MLRNNNVIIDGYETLEDYIDAMEQARKYGKDFAKQLTETGEDADEWRERFEEAAETTEDLTDDLEVARDAVEEMDFSYLGEGADNAKEAILGLLSGPEVYNGITALSNAIDAAGVDWNVIFDASSAETSANEMLTTLANTLGMTEAQVETLIANSGGSWTAVYQALIEILGKVDPSSYNEAATAV
jgi:hypothetical protein